MSETVAAHRWLEEVYDPVVVAIPREAARPPVAAGDLPRDPRAPLVPVRGRPAATSAPPPPPESYFDNVLPAVPEPLSTPADLDELALAEDGISSPLFPDDLP